MEDERRQQDGGDDASVGEASDVTLAGEENSAVMAMFQALMTEIKVKMDQQAEKMLDQQAAQIREAVAGFSQVREEVAAQEPPELERQLCGVTGHCMTLPGPVMCTIAVGGVVELTVSVDDMEEPCLMGVDSLFQNAACDDIGRMEI